MGPLLLQTTRLPFRVRWISVGHSSLKVGSITLKKIVVNLWVQVRPTPLGFNLQKSFLMYSSSIFSFLQLQRPFFLDLTLSFFILVLLWLSVPLYLLSSSTTVLLPLPDYQVSLVQHKSVTLRTQTLKSPPRKVWPSTISEVTPEYWPTDFSSHYTLVVKWVSSKKPFDPQDGSRVNHTPHITRMENEKRTLVLILSLKIVITTVPPGYCLRLSVMLETFILKEPGWDVTTQLSPD